MSLIQTVRDPIKAFLPFSFAGMVFMSYLF